jgi:hypothetical protein
VFRICFVICLWGSHSFSIFLFNLNRDYFGNKMSDTRILFVEMYKEIIMDVCYLSCLSHLP